MTLQSFIQQENIHIIPKDLPTTVRAFVTAGLQDSLIIFINTRLPREIQLTALQHEIDHILKGHLWDESYVEY